MELQKLKKSLLLVLFAALIFYAKSYGDEADDWDSFYDYYQNTTEISLIILTDDISAQETIGDTANNNFTIDGNTHFIDGQGNSGFFFEDKILTFNAITIMNFHDAFEMQRSKIKFISSDDHQEIRITSNSRTWNGGAMAIDTQNDISFENVSVWITSNTSQMNAGGLYVETDSKISFVNASAVFEHNKAATLGGGLYLRESQAYFLNSKIVFDNNRSELYGGAISFFNAGDILFENSDIEFRNNSAQRGGAIFGGLSPEPGIATSFRFINSQVAFFGNDAVQGTAIYLNEEQKIEFINSTVIFGDNAGADKTLLFIHSGAMVSFIGGAVVFSSNTSGRVKFVNERMNLFFAPSKVVFADNIRQESDGIFGYDDFKTDYNGFLTDGNSILFPIEVSRNKTSNGGFLAFEGYREFALNFQAGGIFQDNEAAEKGGVFYLAHSSVSLTSGGDMIFNGNLAGGEFNDIFLEGEATLSLIINKGARIVLGGGLKGGSGSRIIKRGGGDLVLGGNTDYAGDVVLQEGAIVVGTSSIKLNSLQVGRGSVFRADGSDVFITTVANANFEGKFESDLILVNGSLELNNKLYIEDELSADPTFVLLTSRLETRIIQAAIGNSQGGSEIIMTTSQDLQIILPQNGTIRRGGSNIYYSIRYDDEGLPRFVFTKAESRLNADLLDLTKEETEIARWINSSSSEGEMASWKSALDQAADDGRKDELKEALHAIKGDFLANVLKFGAPSIDFSDLYDEIADTMAQSKSGKSISLKWKSGAESFNPDDPDKSEFKTSDNAFKLSLDNARSVGNVYGFFLNYRAKSISQNPDKADINDFSLGIYGGKFVRQLKAKGILAASIKTFDVRRNVQIIDLSFQPQSSFELYGAKLGLELSYPLKKKRLTLEPFAAFAIESLKSGQIAEDSAVGLKADPDILNYLETLWGIKTESKIGKFGWRLKGYFGLDISNRRKIEVRFANDKSASSIDTEAMDDERLFAGAALSGRYDLSPTAAIVVGADAKRSFKNFMRANSAYLGMTIKI